MIGKLVRRYLLNRKTRTILTAFGVASAMVLFIGVASLSRGMDDALTGSSAAKRLIVYRENRYCPQTSFLPERYTSEIEKVDGVTKVLPVKIFLNNCRASLDMVTFQGTPVKRLLDSRNVRLISGDLATFEREHDAALVGRNFAERRNLEPGKKFQLGEIVVKVAGVFESEESIEEELVMTHLEFLQRQGPVDRLGTVTMYEVTIEDSSRAAEIARSIDARFATAEEPTDTRPKLLFLESATKELQEILRMGKLLGLVCVGVVLVLVANTVVMSLHERRKQFGILLAIGYTGRHLAKMVMMETLLLTAGGALFGIATALVAIRLSHMSIGVEGVSITFSTSPFLILEGLAIALVVGLCASVPSAFLAARQNAVQSLRGN
ncbi:MAG TPA: FtsX-like permease family protein [Planctomycetota bacterium]|jgi:putative ABC transport system permease protein|nr:FtsX-like permease family protein [Planctomycetota bacterium]